jgi:hypothetical protein
MTTFLLFITVTPYKACKYKIDHFMPYNLFELLAHSENRTEGSGGDRSVIMLWKVTHKK